MDNGKVCRVCHILTEKTGNHYGAVSCYPCRAFFRRAQSRKRKLVCKDKDDCHSGSKKFCSSCRYEACLRAGMRPENVLDDEGIKARFRYSMNCKSEASVAAQAPDGYNSEPSTSSDYRPPVLYWPQTLQPQTTQQYFQQENNKPQFSLPPPEQSFVRVSVIKRIPPPDIQTIKLEPEDNEDGVKVIIDEGPEKDELEELCPVIIKSDEENYQSLIKEYVHKKFNKSLYNEQHNKPGHPPDELFSVSENLLMDDEVENDLLENLLVSLGPQLESCEVEMFMLTQMSVLFTDCWKKVNFGEQAMAAYINFCSGVGKLDTNLWSYVFQQIRTRFLSFLSAFDMVNLPSNKLFDVLVRNLKTCESLVYVYQFNAPNSDEEVKFIFGEQDRLQWQERSPDVNPTTVANILLHLPMPEESKQFLATCINTLKIRSFHDNIVFILTFLTALFSGEDNDEDVRKLNQTFAGLLRKYFKSKPFLSEEYEMQNIGAVLKALPNLSKCLGQS